MRVGDIVFTTTNQLQSKIIRKTLKSDYSHVLLYVSLGSCIHADSQGVHSINTQRLMFEDATNVFVKRHSQTVNWEHKYLSLLCNYARSKVGTEYSVPEAIKAGFFAKFPHIKVAKHSSLQYCSRLVGETYNKANLNVVDNPDFCTPADIFNSKQLIDVENFLVIAKEGDLEFANDIKRNKIQRQTEITNHLFDEIRTRVNSQIQDWDDIFNHIIKFEQDDELVSKIIEKSTYLDMWKDELNDNPWRYSQKHLALINPPISILERELQMASDDKDRFLSGYIYYKEMYEKRSQI